MIHILCANKQKEKTYHDQNTKDQTKKDQTLKIFTNNNQINALESWISKIELEIEKKEKIISQLQNQNTDDQYMDPILKIKNLKTKVMQLTNANAEKDALISQLIYKIKDKM